MTNRWDRPRFVLFISVIIAGLGAAGCGDESQESPQATTGSAKAPAAAVQSEAIPELPERIEVDPDSDDLGALVEDASPWAVLVIRGGDQPLLMSDGPIAVDRALTIRADPGAPPITTEGRHGVFSVSPQGRLRLQGVEFENAAGPDEPVIENRGFVYLEGVRFADNFRAHGPAVLSSSHRLLAKQLKVENNRSESGPGALAITGGTARFFDVRALENRGLRGGFLANRGQTRIDEGYFSFNEAGEGGALFNGGTLEIRNSAFWSNRSTGTDSVGGALLTEGRAWVTNTTFLSNQATFGSAVVVDRGHLALSHATFEDNKNTAGGDLFVASSAHLVVRNSVLSRSSHTSMSIDVVHGGIVDSLGGNVVPQPEFAWPEEGPELGDHLGDRGPHYSLDLPPAVGSGGWVRVAPLGREHPGRNHVPGSRCLDAHGNPLHHDQVGNPRPIEFVCDAGAHQSSPAPPTISVHER